MTHFHGLCHGKCALSYVEGILKQRKLDFRGLKGQFDVKKANFMGLIAKIGGYRHIFATKTPLWPVFLEYAMGIVPQGMLEGF